ncbi:hypothetical protein Y032_0009g559 [Ancylostoma ceylanicum]|uniref:Ubiquitin carboxyl-terminal hydrolase n=1 Tax=Ancylostoma ceylanicum TaxID=53326 RepID=A0A016VHT7_9BILA|nr:hypothetical protein Y032_0009g559 [Ancylostoma ceylanicum]
MTVLSANEAEHIVHDVDDLAVIDTINSVLDRVEEDLLLEGTSCGTSSNAPVAETSASGSLSNSEERKPETKEAKTTANATSKESDRDVFKLKTIHFDSLKFSIVTQNLNGPCPLIALVNVLVLKGIARLPPSGHVTRDALTHLVADTLLQMRPDNMNTHVESNYNRNLDDVINLLPDLGKGLDVNIRFRHVTDFEFTPALSLFDLLRVNLYHGWLPDPQFVEIRNAIGELTYNQLVERICDENDPNRFLFEEFLSENISQLTYHGLVALMEGMRDGELAVLFRNNHFHTIHKRKDLLYLLVSDSGYVSEPCVVWESFNTVDGSSLFFDGDFKISPLPSSASNELQGLCSTEAESYYPLTMQEGDFSVILDDVFKCMFIFSLNIIFLLAQEMQACEDELARQEAERERIKESNRQEVPPPAPQYSPTTSSRATYERTTYRNGRPIAANSSTKEKKCTIS